jgi:hypothetical protein
VPNQSSPGRAALLAVFRKGHVIVCGYRARLDELDEVTQSVGMWEAGQCHAPRVLDIDKEPQRLVGIDAVDDVTVVEPSCTNAAINGDHGCRGRTKTIVARIPGSKEIAVLNARFIAATVWAPAGAAVRD